MSFFNLIKLIQSTQLVCPCLFLYFKQQINLNNSGFKLHQFFRHSKKLLKVEYLLYDAYHHKYFKFQILEYLHRLCQ